MQRFGLCETIGGQENRFSHVTTMEFASLDALRARLNGGRHEAFVRERFARNVTARATASYESA